MIQKTSLFLISLVISVITASANKLLEVSQKLSISDGLAHNGVTSILEDSKGYLWIGTYDGINVYDGYELATYKNTIYNQVLASNRVRSLAEDGVGNIWIGTDEGVSIYDYETEKFRVVYSQKTSDKNKYNPTVRRIVVSKDGKHILCLTENEGVLVFNNEHKLLSKCLPEEKYDDLIFFDGVELDSANYVFTTTAGLYSFNLNSGSLKFEIPHDNGISNANILLVGNTILATRNKGISIVDYHKEQDNYVFSLRKIKYEKEQLNSVSIDKLGNLWVGTNFKGIIHIKDADAFILDHPYEESRFSNQKDNFIISSVSANMSSGCWVTTFNRGVYRFDVEENPFKGFTKGQGEMYNLYDNSVSHIAVWDEDRVFLSAPRGGFGLFNTKTGYMEKLPFDIPKEAGYISSVFVDSRKDIWLKVVGSLGLCRLRQGERKLRSIDVHKFGIDEDIRPRIISEDQFGNIWMGGESGVYKISLNTNDSIISIEELNQHPFFANTPINLVRCIYTDPLHDYIWIGTDSDGLIRIENAKDKPLDKLEIHRSLRDKSKPYSISSNFVSTIVRLPNGDMWIGTERGGICKVLNYDQEPKFIAFTEKDGLSNNVVKRIFYDNEYNLWIATNVGLNKFFIKDQHFRSFYESDGLPFEDFWYSFGKLNNGIVVLSGMKGICYFKPLEIKDDEPLPRLEFSKLRIFNQEIAPGDTINSRVLLTKRLNSTKDIELNYNENVFSLVVNSLHFSSPDNHYLKYQLSPVNKEWIQVRSGQRVISYSGLRPGEYTLRVMASNSLYEWTVPKELHIVIKPPIWKTTQAYVVYVIFIVVIILVVMYFVLKLQSLKHNLQIEHLEKDKEKEINVAKLRFFSNISHEIKTPLTLISGPINILAERFQANNDVSDKLKIVQRQSKKISRLVDQVHDFQRLEANLLKMDITQFCFDDFINELKSDFDFLARSDKKVFTVKGEDAKIYVSADRDKLEKILNNIINNAFKYTPVNSSILINYKKIEKNLYVSVEDTGKGIDPEDLPHIFERFYQSKKKHSAYTGGSGIGLAFSKRLVEMHYGDISAKSTLGKGSVFELRLPIVVDGVLSPDENEKILKAEKDKEQASLMIPNVDVHHIKSNDDFKEASVFFVEDSTEMRDFVSGVLKAFFKVKSFVNGQECMDAMKDEWPDIVISDVLMPELNGFDLCKAIKADIKTSHIPVILLTACTALDDQIQGLQLGADAYIRKPFDVQHLITRTETLLRGRQQLRERYSIDLPLTQRKDDTSAKDNAFLEKLYQLMEQNLDNQDLDLDLFAKELYLNRTHFFQKVKAITNQTPYELLKNYRIKKAAEFLGQEKMSVNEAFVMTGFKSRAHFNKLFKEKYQVTPGKYAVEMKNKYTNNE